MTNREYYFEVDGGTLPDEVKEVAEEYGVPFQERYRGADVVRFESSNNYRSLMRETVGENGETIQQSLGREFHNFKQVERRLDPKPVAADGSGDEEFDLPEPGKIGDMDHNGNAGGYEKCPAKAIQRSFDRGREE